MCLARRPVSRVLVRLVDWLWARRPAVLRLIGYLCFIPLISLCHVVSMC
jgi:hypothetical protein